MPGLRGAAVLQVAALALALTAALAARAQGPPSPRPCPSRPGTALSVADIQERSQVVALIEESKLQAALDVVDGLIARGDCFAFDWINRAHVLVRLLKFDEALASLERARDPSYDEALLLSAFALKKLRRYPEAEKDFRTLLARNPHCLEALFHLGLVLQWGKREDEALAQFARMAAVPAAAYRSDTGTHRKGLFLAHKFQNQILMIQGKDAEAERHFEVSETLRAQGFLAKDDDLDVGPRYGPIDLDHPRARAELARAGLRVPPSTATVAPLELAPAGPPRMPALALGAGARAPVRAWVTSHGPRGPTALLLSSGAEATTWVTGPTGVWSPARPGPVTGLTALDAGDLDGDGVEELVGLVQGRLWAASRARDGSYRPVALPADVAQPTSLLMVDAEHDGDLDLVVAGRFGGRLPGLVFLENRGEKGLSVAPGVGLTTATGRVYATLALGDVDEGSDIDVAAFAPGHPPEVFLSRRQGLFDRVVLGGPAVADVVPGGAAGGLADMDGDGLLDVVYLARSGPVVQIGPGEGTFGPVRVVEDRRRVGAAFGLGVADLDNDGRPDLIVAAGGAGAVVNRGGKGRGLTLLRNQLSPGGGGRFAPFPAPRGLGAGASLAGAPLAADLDADGDLDLVVPVIEKGRHRPIVLENRRASEACFVVITLAATGGKTNPVGRGSRVWVRVGTRRQRREVLHAGELFGLGGASGADVVRVHWTNGVVQNHVGAGGGPLVVAPEPGKAARPVLAVPCRTRLTIPQKSGLDGSCPYLYVGEGSELSYVTDVLAGAPIGLPLASGGTAPADPEELVLLGRERLAGRSRVTVRVTEEYREVTYVDALGLWVVDHPAGVTVVADEGIGAQGPARLVPLARVEPMVGAVALRGRGPEDARKALDRTDQYCLEPPDGAIQGLAPEHTLTLTLPAVGPGEPTYLVMEGFVYWTDSGLNLRLAQEAPGRLHPPILEVPDGAGGWRPARAAMRFPAGRTKACLVEVTGQVDPADPRLRIRSTMRVYWDSIRVGRNPSREAERALERSMVVRRLEPARATLLWHGFRRLRSVRQGPPGVRWCWTSPEPPPPWTVDAQDRVGEPEAEWLVPAGDYTRYGPVRTLVGGVDDRLVVFGPGDGIEAEFDLARAAGPWPEARSGTARDCFLYVFGYCKDAHPATWSSRTVEPVPARGAAVYGPPGRWPVAGQAWRRIFSTRRVSCWDDLLREARRTGAARVP